MLARLEPEEYGLSGFVTDADPSDFQSPAVTFAAEVCASRVAGKLSLMGGFDRPSAVIRGPGLSDSLRLDAAGQFWRLNDRSRWNLPFDLSNGASDRSLAIPAIPFSWVQ